MSEVNKKFGIVTHWGQLDTTSFHVDGEYIMDEGDEALEKGEDVEEERITNHIRITHGYSRDNRDDLKQVNLALMCEGLHGMPIFMKTLSGNSNDTKVFQEILKGFKKNLTLPEGLEGFVMDAAGFSTSNVEFLLSEEIPFVIRA